jgi:WD40 repeat protein
VRRGFIASYSKVRFPRDYFASRYTARTGWSGEAILFPMPGVFLSYARADGEAKAAALRERLKSEADIVIKQDFLFLEGGVGWWNQITAAIDSVEFLVLLMTPAALDSGNVQKEWRYARRQGVCVYPVKAVPDADLRFDKMPRWMEKAHFYDLDKEWPTFLAHLRKGCDTPRVPFMAPNLPARFTERHVEFEALKSLLLTADGGQPVAITTALSGAGGFGKTTLAAALCHDEDIVANFDGGILWVTLGQTPNLVVSLLTLYAAVAGERPSFSSVEDAAYQFGEKLNEQNCLLVIDDVWDNEHLRPFLRGGKSCARLFTTRDSAIASAGRPVRVDRMQEAEAVELLAKGVAGLQTERAQALARRLGEWPLALELASAMIRERIRQGESAERASGRLLTIVERKGVGALQDPTAEPRQRTISSVLEASLDLLDAGSSRRLAEISIFPEDVEIPLAAAAAVWELDELDSEELAQHFARLSLLKLDFERGVLSLHDVMRRWLASTVSSAREIHNRLVNSWPDWRELPDLPGEYAWRWLPWHLAQAGRRQDIERLLWDPLWMYAKLAATEVNALVTDYDHLKPSSDVDLLQGALRLSSHILTADPPQFASQITGRLLSHCAVPAIGRFVSDIAEMAPTPWLRPLRPALDPPGTPLIRTLYGHSSPVKGVAITHDGGRAISASEDKTLKIWDLTSGRELRTLRGHSAAVNGVAVSADGKRVASGSQDKTVRIWDLESGHELITLEGHSDAVNGVTLSQNAKRAVSASVDHTIKVWDVESGELLRTLVGHSSPVNSVALSANGMLLASASDDRTVRLWNMDTGRLVQILEQSSARVLGLSMSENGRRIVAASSNAILTVWDISDTEVAKTLQGHSFRVTAVAITSDGMWAVSAGEDKCVKLWNLEQDRPILTMIGHSARVNSVAITTDRRTAISASDDNTLKIWNLDAETIPQQHAPHSGSVNSVIVNVDGQRALTASSDRSVRIWDTKTGTSSNFLSGHSSYVTSVAITSDGTFGVSASDDDTVRVWDLDRARTLHRLIGHTGRVNGVALSWNCQFVVSASFDKTLKVWDFETGQFLRSLIGHAAAINSVATISGLNHAISACEDKTLKIWDLESGCELRTLHGHAAPVKSVGVSADGKIALSASDDGMLKLWDLESEKEPATLIDRSSGITNAALNAEATMAISVSKNKTVTLWHLPSGVSMATFVCDAPATCCAFSSEHTVIVGDVGGEVHFLSIELQQRS